MFFVFHKEKIYSYIVALSTVIVLFVTASVLSNIENNTLTTSSSNSELHPIYCVDCQENKVSLTINCAWNAEDINSILETLAKYDVKITFFVVGDWVDQYPEAVKKIYNAGHEIANHSDTHPHINQLTYEKNVEQLLTCSQKVEALTGEKTRLYRGPYGEYNDTVIRAALDNDHQMIQWSIDTLDYNGLEFEQMWNRINDKIEKGSIILMHNGTAHTADSLEQIILHLKEKGYEIVKVSDLIYHENYLIDSSGKQKNGS